MYAIYTMRKLMLTNRINTLNAKLMEISQKTQDLAAYGANISDGFITPEEAANSPASLFKRQSLYMTTTVQNAWNQASVATQTYLTMNQGTNAMVGNTIDPTGTTTNPNQALLNQAYFKQAMEAAAKNEEKKIEVIEKELDQQRLKIETQLKAAEAELEGVEKAEDQGIKASAPKYLAGNG